MNLLIVGAGQYGCLVKEIAEATGQFKRIEFIDNHSSKAIATFDSIADLRSEYEVAIVAIGNAEVRLEYLNNLQSYGYRLVSLIHPRAYVSPSAKIEAGCVIEPFSVVQANTWLGKGCLISSGAVVNHNAILEDGCHIDCNATVKARAIVKARTKIESGQVCCEP